MVGILRIPTPRAPLPLILVSLNIGFIIHPASLDVMQIVRRAVDRLREEGHEVEGRITFEGGDATRFAREMAGDHDILLAVGGDGTLNEVVNGLHEHATSQKGGSLPTLAIVPVGTGNDLAHALGIPPDPAAAIEAGTAGIAVEVDLAMVNGRCFLNVSSGGIGAEATDETSSEAKRALGRFAYLITGMRKFATLHPTHGRFRRKETLYDGPFLLFAVGNSRFTGAGNRLTPRASLVDGMLDLCIVQEMPRRELLGLLPALRSGEHLDHPRVLYTQVDQLEIEAEAEMSVNADGEPLRGRSFEYSLADHSITLAIPRAPTQDAEPRQDLLGLE